MTREHHYQHSNPADNNNNNNNNNARQNNNVNNTTGANTNTNNTTHPRRNVDVHERNDAQPPSRIEVGGVNHEVGATSEPSEVIDYSWLVFNESQIKPLARAITPFIESHPDIHEIYNIDSICDALTAMLDLRIVAHEYSLSKDYRHEPSSRNFHPDKYLTRGESTIRSNVAKFCSGRFAVNTDYLFTSNATSPITLVEQALVELFNHRHQPLMDVLWQPSAKYYNTCDVLTLGNHDCDNTNYSLLTIPNLAQKTEWELRWLFPNHVDGHDAMLTTDLLVIDRSLDDVALATHFKSIYFGSVVTERCFMETIHELPRVFNVVVPPHVESCINHVSHEPNKDPYDILDDTNDIEIRTREFPFVNPESGRFTNQVDYVISQFQRANIPRRDALLAFKRAFLSHDLCNARASRFRGSDIYPNDQRQQEDAKRLKMSNMSDATQATTRSMISATLNDQMFSVAAANIFKRIATQTNVAAGRLQTPTARRSGRTDPIEVDNEPPARAHDILPPPSPSPGRSPRVSTTTRASVAARYDNM